MKNLLFALILLGGMLQAGQYTKEDRIKDMKTMAEAMNTIQSGFFYNNYEIVESGADTLMSTIVKVKPPVGEMDGVMQRYMNKNFQVTNKVVKKINQKALTTLQRFKAGDSAQATQAYTKIVGQCMKCHREIRNW